MTTTDISLRMTRDQILARLQEQLLIAEAHDAEQLKAHRQAEADYLKQFRDACRAALKWDYQTAKTNYFRPLENAANRSPACPRPVAPRIKEAIRVWSIDGRTSKNQLTIAERGRNGTLYYLLTWTPDPIDMSGGCK